MNGEIKNHPERVVFMITSARKLHLYRSDQEDVLFICLITSKALFHHDFNRLEGDVIRRE